MIIIIICSLYAKENLEGLLFRLKILDGNLHRALAFEGETAFNDNLPGSLGHSINVDCFNVKEIENNVKRKFINLCK